jgi:AcrR family transcriptional regulator
MAQQRAEATKERILQIAVEVFARNGYDATGVAEICLRAGISKGAFYHHFPSKQSLYLHILDEWLSGIDAGLREVRDNAGSVPAALREMTGVFAQVLVDGRDRMPIFLEFLTNAARDREIRKALIRPYRRYRRYFAGMLEQGIAEGTVGECDPETVSALLVSLAVGMLMQSMLEPEGVDWTAVARTAVPEFILDIVEPA